MTLAMSGNNKLFDRERSSPQIASPRTTAATTSPNHRSGTKAGDSDTELLEISSMVMIRGDRWFATS